MVLISWLKIIYKLSCHSKTFCCLRIVSRYIVIKLITRNEMILNQLFESTLLAAHSIIDFRILSVVGWFSNKQFEYIYPCADKPNMPQSITALCLRNAACFTTFPSLSALYDKAIFYSSPSPDIFACQNNRKHVSSYPNYFQPRRTHYLLQLYHMLNQPNLLKHLHQYKPSIIRFLLARIQSETKTWFGETSIILVLPITPELTTMLTRLSSDATISTPCLRMTP